MRELLFEVIEGKLHSSLSSQKLFMALCRRYSLNPYRYARQRYTTVMVRAPEAFIDDVLWPQYQALSKELKEYLDQATEKIISEEVHRDTTDAQEIVQLDRKSVV